ncbi:MAG: 2OG-Fe dioxygenase family protein, partial [Gammaproteobacteria bacterium]
MQLTQTPHRAHWQPVEYNALHGGMRRLFEPVEPETVAQAGWQRLLVALGALCTQVAASGKGAPPTWYVEAHQFRI